MFHKNNQYKTSIQLWVTPYTACTVKPVFATTWEMGTTWEGQLLQSLGLFSTQRWIWEIRPPQNWGQSQSLGCPEFSSFHCIPYSRTPVQTPGSPVLWNSKPAAFTYASVPVCALLSCLLPWEVQIGHHHPNTQKRQKWVSVWKGSQVLFVGNN